MRVRWVLLLALGLGLGLGLGLAMAPARAASVSPPMVELNARGVGQTVLRAPAQAEGIARLWSAELIRESEVLAAAAGVEGGSVEGGSVEGGLVGGGVVSPAFFELAPNGLQVIRVRLPPGAEPVRLLLRQQPVAEADASQVRLQLILPVRAAQPGAGQRGAGR